ncbi:hypothetical protein XAR_4465 [Xanthomonas citri pv. glycines str. 8ra]|nr:hypothetical protein XAR_4465 [Xanthomonas citri pv. glycines str. 8ra]
MVDGSNPSRPTNKFNDLDGAYGAFFVRLEKLLEKKPEFHCSTAPLSRAAATSSATAALCGHCFFGGLTTGTWWS